jgi:hypothetical protein
LLALTACGRIGFDDVGGGGGGGTSEAGSSGAISWAGAVVGRFLATPHPGDTFTAQARAAGDAIVVHVACGSSTQPPTVTMTAAGWSFSPISPLSGSAAIGWVASFGAIAPDTSPVAVSVYWGTLCDLSELGDEFTNVDPTITFDGHAEASGSGNCAGTITTSHDGDAIWAGCSTFGNTVTATGPGFTKGADDGNGDWSEYAITTDPAGSLEAVTFASSSVFAMTMAALKPR